jgi:hypothetical protein
MPLLLARLISRTRLSWTSFTVALCLALVLFSIATAYLDGTLGAFFATDHWRDALFYPALITYILAIIPALLRSGDAALEAIQPLVQLDDESFDRLLDDTTVITPRGELGAFGVGVALGILSLAPWQWVDAFSWTILYWATVILLEGGLLAWCIYAAFAGTKPIATVHRHLGDVDILDISRFEPIGRTSLLSSLAFIGGAAIHFFFQVGGEHLFEVGSLIVYGILVVVSTLIFFLSMGPTHRVLAAAKQKELQRAQHNIIAAYRSLESIPAGSPEIGGVSAKLNLLEAYEQRLKGIRTWPYNLGMLRTLAISVLTPVAMNLLQRLVGQVFG